MDTSVYHYKDYRAYLRDVLSDRCRANPRYTLRAFARDLELRPSWLSEILNRKKGLSASTAAKIADVLGMAKEEGDYFCDLINSTHSRSKVLKRAAELRLQRPEVQNHFKTLEPDFFRLISDWYHYAILELILLEDFKNDAAWIAKRLGINTIEAKEAVERLKRLELLEEKSGKLIRKNDVLTTHQDVPSEGIRKFNKQVLNKAIAAIELQNVKERDFSTFTMAIDRSRLPELKEKIGAFRKSISQKFEQGKRNEVYCLAIQLFKLTEPSEKERIYEK